MDLPCYQMLVDFMASQTLENLQMQGLHMLSQVIQCFPSLCRLLHRLHTSSRVHYALELHDAVVRGYLLDIWSIQALSILC